MDLIKDPNFKNSYFERLGNLAEKLEQLNMNEKFIQLQHTLALEKDLNKKQVIEFDENLIK